MKLNYKIFYTSILPIKILPKQIIVILEVFKIFIQQIFIKIQVHHKDLMKKFKNI
jgi:hypothetical protein